MIGFIGYICCCILGAIIIYMGLMTIDIAKKNSDELLKKLGYLMAVIIIIQGLLVAWGYGACCIL